ncbi:MAG: protein-disulfide reductase DsbD domain-containing protein [Myxococcota bacterium]
MIRNSEFGWALASVLCLGAALPVTARANPVEAPHLQASLVTLESSVVPGETVTAAVHFELEPEWHLYWRNPGDSGEAPTFEWRLPDGFTPGEVAWPAPHPIRVGPLVNYGYEGELLLPVSIDVPEALSQQAAEGDEVALSVVARWLVCREDCIPGEATLTLTLPVRSKPTPPRTAHASLFAQVEREQPKPIRGRAVDDGDAVIVDIAVDTAQLGDAPHVTLFPYDALVLDHAAEQETEYRPDGVSLRVRKDPTRDKPLDALAGLVVLEGDDGRRVFDLDTTVIREAPPEGMTPSSAEPNTAPTSPENAPATPLAIVLFLAFCGGVLLNLMPCVFPVLSLKILGVLEHANDLAATRRDGRIYTAGVLVSFWVVAGLLLALRAGGERLGWGFQLQSPEFIAALAILMTLVALNLLGTFEVGIGLSRLGAVGGTGSAEAPSPRHAMLSSFVTGALAVIVATPCTAPFMGTAIGFALTRSPGVALLVFTALGLGMALPYLALGYVPGVVRRLPRPGAWMAVLRQVLAFPMLAVAIWLLTVLAALTDDFTAFRLLGGLLVIALGAWVYGQYQRSVRRPVAAIALAAVLVTGGVVFGTRGVEASESRASTRATTADGLWQPWSAARVAELRAEGRPVLVNFTADWCISCKANELVVFQADAVRDALARYNVAALKADWTRRDEAITRELQAHGRAGVPLYLYYPADGEGEPSTLPSVLTPSMVLAQLNGR